MNREDIIKDIARKHYNVTGDVPNHIRAEIQRKFHLPDNARQVVHKREGESRQDALDRQSRAQHAAEWDQKQRQPPDRRSNSLKAAEGYVELCRVKLNRERSNIHNRKYLQKQLDQAEAELQAVIEREQREAQELATAKALSSNEAYQNTLENAEACLRLASNEDYQDAYLRLHRLKSVNDPSEIESAVREYWSETAKAEEAAAKKLEQSDDYIESQKKAAEATRAAVDVEKKILNAKQKAEEARIHAGDSNDMGE